ncbi:MAG: COG4315 family predicted lipoprotein [Burkholderiaceae bacterium]
MKHTMMFAAIAVVTLAVQANPTQISNGVMASKEGKTLYTFDKDVAGKSNCNGGCAAAWPPFVVAKATLAGGDFSIVKRDDGASQWAFKRKPLYFFGGDAKAGDVNGDKQGGVWHVLRSEPKKTSIAPDTSYSAGYNYN